MRIIVATHNEGKLVEINRILEDCLGVDADQVELVDIEPDDLIIMGDREEDHLQAIAQNVSCIIVGMGIEVSEKVIKLAHEREIVIIMSPYDTFTIARLINQSIPVRYIMKTDNLVTFNTED